MIPLLVSHGVSNLEADQITRLFLSCVVLSILSNVIKIYAVSYPY